LKIILLFLLALNLVAQENDDFSVRFVYGKATASTLGDVLSGKIESPEYDFNVAGVDGAYLLQRSAFDWPMDIYVKSGISRFSDSAYSLASSKSVYEMTLYIKFYWNFDFLDNRVRFGFGEGGSYTSDILSVEQLEGEAGDAKSYFLNYLDISADFDFGRLIHYRPLHNTYIGWALKHRSGIFGLVNGVTKGGSNYNTIYLEKNF